MNTSTKRPHAARILVTFRILAIVLARDGSSTLTGAQPILDLSYHSVSLNARYVRFSTSVDSGFDRLMADIF